MPPGAAFRAFKALAAVFFRFVPPLTSRPGTDGGLLMPWLQRGGGLWGLRGGGGGGGARRETGEKTMASNLEFVQFVCDQLGEQVSCRRMFGGIRAFCPREIFRLCVR